jgi:hypothetical protein
VVGQIGALVLKDLVDLHKHLDLLRAQSHWAQKVLKWYLRLATARGESCCECVL